MIENAQVLKLRMRLRDGESLSRSALNSGMSEKTGRKYRESTQLPCELSSDRTWRTRKDPFENVWVYVHAWIETASPCQVPSMRLGVVCVASGVC